MVGGELTLGVRNQRRLGRPCLAHKFEEAGVTRARCGETIAFQVVFDPVPGEPREQLDVLRRDMAAIGARMHGDSTAACADAGFGGSREVRFVAAAGVPQHRDLVEIDAEDRHRKHPAKVALRKVRPGMAVLAFIRGDRTADCRDSSATRRTGMIARITTKKGAEKLRARECDPPVAVRADLRGDFPYY